MTGNMDNVLTEAQLSAIEARHLSHKVMAGYIPTQ